MVGVRKLNHFLIFKHVLCYYLNAFLKVATHPAQQNTHSAGFSTFPLKCPLQIVILGHTSEMSHTDPGAVIPHLCRTEARTNPNTTHGTGLTHGPCRRLA